MSSISLELKKVGSIDGEFFVEDYQRGYRWSDEVKMLLDDLNEIEEGADYCLQPIVVTKKDEYYYVIDGQQRLTTITLIHRYLQKSSFLREYASLRYLIFCTSVEAFGDHFPLV